MNHVVLMSGGLDSTVLAAHLLDFGHEVIGVAVNYGQRHEREVMAAFNVAAALNVPLHLIEMPDLAAHLPGSSQTDRRVAVPEGHYAAPNMAATVVPNRNMVLLSVAAAVAIAHGCEAIAYAAHAGDHPVYPDCRPSFIESMRHALTLCHEPGLMLVAPFATWSKADVVKRGIAVDAPMHFTWSCYVGGDAPCGKCGTCVERAEAFALNLEPDRALARS